MTEPKNYEEWVASRPTIVRKLLEKYPCQSKLVVCGLTYYVLGATEGGQLIVSQTNPGADYEKATETREYVCGDCLSGEHIHQCHQ